MDYVLCNVIFLKVVPIFRTIYKEADVYLLDDPLSAVDTHVGHHLFDDCICDFLQGKTRLLVTHQLQYLQAADNIVILSNVCWSPCVLKTMSCVESNISSMTPCSLLEVY
jgi:ABC-type nitrate/sulfonate/bicarbonate transport system ATPase subunit